MEDLKLKFFPLKDFAVLEGLVNLDRFAQDASQIIAARILEDVNHILITPNLRPVMADEVGETVQVIVVHMAGHDDVNRFHAELRLKLGNGVLNKTHAIVNGSSVLIDAEDIPACRTVIHEERLTAVADQGVKTRSRVNGCDQMGRNGEGLALHRQEPAAVSRVPALQFINQPGDSGVHLREGFTMRRADQSRSLFANSCQRKDGAVNSIRTAV